MKDANERFGVVNTEKRAMYEKLFQVPYGYDYMTFHKKEAIRNCKSLNDPKYIVERIFDNAIASNNKEEIFRSGSFKEGDNEKNN